MRSIVLIHLYAISCAELAHNIVEVILEINDYITTNCQNVTRKKQI